MSSRRTLCLILLGLLLCNPATAQEDPASSGQQPVFSGVGRLNFMVGVPMGSFRDNIEGLGYGGNLFGGLRIGTTPLVMGLDVGLLVYGRTVDTVPFSTTVGPRVTVEVVTTNSILEPHLVLRLQPIDGVVRPYLDGLLGFKYLFTETRVRDEDLQDDDRNIASSTNFSDAAFSGGAAAGLDIRVFQGTPEQDVRSVSIHVGMQALLGGQAEYLAEGSLEDENQNGQLDEEELDIRRSQTSLIQPQVGVTMDF